MSELKLSETELINKEIKIGTKKYKKGQCIYIAKNYLFDDIFRLGYTGNLTERINYYSNDCKIIYACFCPNAKLVKICIDAKYEKNKENLNKDWIKGVSVQEIVENIKKLNIDLKNEYEEITEIEYGNSKKKEQINKKANYVENLMSSEKT